jgi:hypothetical protein
LLKQDGPTGGLELDLEQYLIPTPTTHAAATYAANLTENPRSKLYSRVPSQNYENGMISGPHGYAEKVVILSLVYSFHMK